MKLYIDTYIRTKDMGVSCLNYYVIRIQNIKIDLSFIGQEDKLKIGLTLRSVQF